MITLLGGRAAAAADAAVGYAVVVGEDVPVADITLDELRRVFLMKRAFWKPGKPIRLVLPASGLPARSFMLQYVCQKTEGEMRRLVLESMYRGDSDQPPKVAGSDIEALGLLASIANGVALVSAETSPGPRLKVLRVEGKLPSDQGYPLAP
jgi:hypothetical protein